jgi:polysaccharide pyruvyl transferase WcaK-like protein
MQDLLRTAAPDAKFQAFPNSGMQTLRQYSAYWKALRSADLVIFGGGQEIQDHASVAFLVSGLLKIILARRARVPVLCYAIGVGPLGTSLGRLLTRRVLQDIPHISVRDLESRRALRALGVTRSDIRVTADPAVALEPQKLENTGAFPWPKGSGPRIVFAPRRWYHYGNYVLPMKWRSRVLTPRGRDRFARLVEQIATAADSLIETQDARFVLCPMRSAHGRIDLGQDDDQVCHEIREQMRISGRAAVWPEPPSPGVLKGLLGSADIVIGMRMHALIFASMMEVPVIGITILPKHLEFLRQIDQDEFSVDPDTLSAQNLSDMVMRAVKGSSAIRAQLIHAREVLRVRAMSDAADAMSFLGRRGAGQNTC